MNWTVGIYKRGHLLNRGHILEEGHLLVKRAGYLIEIDIYCTGGIIRLWFRQK